MNRWPCDQRRKAELEARLNQEIDERLRKGSEALARAAVTLADEPHLLIKLPIEGSAEVEFVAANHGELSRLVDSLDNGPYAGFADLLRGRS